MGDGNEYLDYPGKHFGVYFVRDIILDEMAVFAHPVRASAQDHHVCKDFWMQANGEEFTCCQERAMQGT